MKNLRGVMLCLVYACVLPTAEAARVVVTTPQGTVEYLDTVVVWEHPTTHEVRITYFQTRKPNGSSLLSSGETDEVFLDRVLAQLRPVYAGYIETRVPFAELPTTRGDDVQKARREQWRLKNGKVWVDPSAPAPMRERANKKQLLQSKVEQGTATINERLELLELTTP